MEKDRQRIGASITAIRNELGITQQELSDHSGITRTTVSKIESGKYNASIDLVSKLISPIGYEIKIVKTVR